MNPMLGKCAIPVTGPNPVRPGRHTSPHHPRFSKSKGDVTGLTGRARGLYLVYATRMFNQ